MAKLPGRNSTPMNQAQLDKYRQGLAEMKHTELARHYRWLHGLIALQEGQRTPATRTVQEFMQVWREANRRGRITPFPNVR
jgi:hypothetical protein